jgi:uncharacterized lipoprotein YmbA
MRRILVAAVLLLAACASAPEVRHYSLDEFASQQGSSCAETGSTTTQVTVRPFNVLPPFDTTQIVYRPPDLPQTIGFYASHQWATSPERMVAQATVDYLCRIGINAELSALESPINAITVSANVSELLEVDTPKGPSGQVALTLRVQDNDGELIFEEQLWGRVLAQERTVDSVVEAIDKALQLALSEVRAPLERLVQGHTSSDCFDRPASQFWK